MNGIQTNRIQCRICGEVVTSRSAHDLRLCSCGAVGVDGGREYLRRLGAPEDWTERSTFVSDFHAGKAHRTAYYYRFVYGWRERPCAACAGSGRYDHHGSPPCGACGGTGRERYPGPKALLMEMERIVDGAGGGRQHGSGRGKPT